MFHGMNCISLQNYGTFITMFFAEQKNQVNDVVLVKFKSFERSLIYAE